ncbi:hypothetical protein EGW08_019828 [Elysia chlorotica]|uniref:Uncharacterized protein n=1 Tax=Elysia chlorotica TaxID=188477 RepID=A0A3S1B152_ELYCH|nr:hypothetical protein EGW08_019828 [Elysia chlorotica]
MKLFKYSFVENRVRFTCIVLFHLSNPLNAISFINNVSIRYPFKSNEDPSLSTSFHALSVIYRNTVAISNSVDAAFASSECNVPTTLDLAYLRYSREVSSAFFNNRSSCQSLSSQILPQCIGIVEPSKEQKKPTLN